MATARLQNDTDAATISATFTRRDGELRVIFSSEIAAGEGFSLAELDVLQGAIAHARRHMLEDETTPTLALMRPQPKEDGYIETRYRTQLRQMNPVPT
jgi:hypothetical protein